MRERTKTRRIQLHSGDEEEVRQEVGASPASPAWRHTVRKASYSCVSPAVVFSGVSGGKHHCASSSSPPCSSPCSSPRVSSIGDLRPAPGGSAALRLRTERLKVQRLVLERPLHVAEHPSILDPRPGGVGTEPGQEGGAVVLLAEPFLRHPEMMGADQK